MSTAGLSLPSVTHFGERLLCVLAPIVEIHHDEAFHTVRLVARKPGTPRSASRSRRILLRVLPQQTTRPNKSSAQVPRRVLRRRCCRNSVNAFRGNPLAGGQLRRLVVDRGVETEFARQPRAFVRAPSCPPPCQPAALQSVRRCSRAPAAPETSTVSPGWGRPTRACRNRR